MAVKKNNIHNSKGKNNNIRKISVQSSKIRLGKNIAKKYHRIKTVLCQKVKKLGSFYHNNKSTFIISAIFFVMSTIIAIVIFGISEKRTAENHRMFISALILTDPSKIPESLKEEVSTLSKGIKPKTADDFFLLGYDANMKGLSNARNSGKDYFDVAIENYRESIRLAPTTATAAAAYQNMGQIYLFGKKDYIEAIHCFRKKIEIQPADAYDYDMLGISYQELGKETEAKKSEYSRKAWDLRRKENSQ